MKYIVSFVIFLLSTASAQAGTYYTSTSGSDANSCATAQSITGSNNKRTISAGVSCLAAGDTLYIRTGTYTGTVNAINSNATVVNGGTNFSGGAITVSAYPTETVTIQIGSGSGGNAIEMGSSVQQYIIFNRLILDGTGTGAFSGGLWHGPGSAHIRFQNGEIKNFRGQGVLTSASASGDLQVLSSHIHHNGEDTTPQSHNIYLESNSNIIDGNEIDNGASFGVTLYDTSTHPSNNIIRNNRFHDNAIYHGAEIGVAGGDNNQVYNNVIYGSGPGYAMYIAIDTPTNTLIYCNTIVLSGGIYIDTDASGTIFRGNINRSTNNAGAGTFVNVGTSTTNTNNYTSNPTFNNVATDDYTLNTTSTAKNTGPTIALVTTDLNGVSRPQGTFYEYGAFEFVEGGGPPPVDPPFVPGPGNLRILRHR